MNRRIYDYYPLALAEGEGAGTAYEYYVKAKMLHRVMQGRPTPRRVLVGGLPEKYGLSMDFALLAQDWQAEILFLDERPARLQKFAATYDELSEKGLLSVTCLKYRVVEDIARWDIGDKFDLVLCCEVLQRLDAKQQLSYFSQLADYAERAIIFAPNGENPKHAELSGLKTVSLAQMLNLVKQSGYQQIKAGLIDMPPFPPGITRSEAQRQDAASSPLQRFLFWGINVWADAEQLMPWSLKKGMAHIVYAALDTGAQK
jgi:hypothetical protein